MVQVHSGSHVAQLIRRRRRRCWCWCFVFLVNLFSTDGLFFPSSNSSHVIRAQSFEHINPTSSPSSANRLPKYCGRHDITDYYYRWQMNSREPMWSDRPIPMIGPEVSLLNHFCRRQYDFHFAHKMLPSSSLRSPVHRLLSVSHRYRLFRMSQRGARAHVWILLDQFRVCVSFTHV